MRRLAAYVAVLVLAGGAAAETLVTTRTIRAAATIGPQDLTRIPELVPGALQDPALVIGMEARTVLYAGRPIQPGDIGPAAIVERNQNVLLAYRRGGLSILAEGRALGRGAVGEQIRAINSGSRNTVSGVIGPDGTVHVIGTAQFPGH